MKRVLNVGGGSRDNPIPLVYQGWEHVLLDIDPERSPDIVRDARELSQLPSSEYDAVYCSHNLEHYYRHDVSKVLLGFLHVLKDDGFAQIIVPDLGDLMRIVVQKGMDIDDVVFRSQGRLVTVRDVLFGYGVEIERSGRDFYAHKTGFTRKSLFTILKTCGFANVFIASDKLEITAVAFKTRPSESATALLGLPPLGQPGPPT